MAAAAATVAALLVVIVAQAASAFVVPEVVLMRVKRNPEPMRSFSYSGFNPNGQMAAFTGLSEYPMFSNYGLPPSPSQAGPYRYGQDAYGPPIQDSYGPSPSGPSSSGAEQQQAESAADPTKKPSQYERPAGAAAVNQPQEYGQRPADNPDNESGEQQQADNKKQYHRGGSSSNAEASFNAWFPIMFGVFPNGANGQSSGNSAGRYDASQGPQGSGQGNSHAGGPERSSGTTVIANSVSNGRHGVATSHAISYGNPRSLQQSSRK